jgi:protein-tyrosine-phosphatase
LIACWALAAAAGLDTARIESLTGAKGALDEEEGVFKVSVPRSDLTVTAAGVRITPPMGLTSWAAFKQAGEHAMVMGDLVLLEDQVNPVMSVALDQGLEVTALHNHFFWDTPRVMFMHISGLGDEATLASAVGRVFARIAETSGGKGDVPRAEIDPARTTLDPKKIDAVLGHPGTLSGGVYKVVIGRTAGMHGHDVGAAMGVNTWAAFAGSDERAVVDGDFAMLESELQGVLKALRGAGIDVVAIHHHMTGEEPRILFLHYWGVGRTVDLAQGLRAALEVTALPKRVSTDTVVFVCERGSVKSLMAREWFDRLAGGRGLGLRAVARGMKPDPSVPTAIGAGLRRDGFDVSSFEPRALAPGDLARATRIVAIGVDRSAIAAPADVPVESWEGIPPATQQYEAARDALRARIEGLLAALEGAERAR